MKKIIIFSFIFIMLFSFIASAYLNYPIPDLSLTNGGHWIIYSSHSTGESFMMLSQLPKSFKLYPTWGDSVAFDNSISNDISGSALFMCYKNVNGVWVTDRERSYLPDSSITVVFTNKDVINALTGEVVYEANMEEDNADTTPIIAINYPVNNQLFSKNNKIITKVEFRNIPYNGNIKQMHFFMTGYIETIIKENNFITPYWIDEMLIINMYGLNFNDNFTTVSGYIDITGTIPFNIDVILTAKIVDYTGVYYDTSVTVKCFQDFIDENDDNIDDRLSEQIDTGSFGGTGTTGSWGDDSFGSSMPTTNNPLDWLKWIGDSIKSLFSTVNNILTSSITFFGNFANMFGSVFSYVPKQMVSLMILGFAVVVILRIFKR